MPTGETRIAVRMVPRIMEPNADHSVSLIVSQAVLIGLIYRFPIFFQGLNQTVDLLIGLLLSPAKRLR